MKPGISAVIVAYNQADLLKKCLKSIYQIVDEIIIIDLGSTDDLSVLASFYHAKLVAHEKVEIVESIRQWSLSLASFEYVIFLDPDESLGKELTSDLVSKIKTGQYDYFVTPRQNYVFGKWVRHSRWWPDLQTRIFRVGQVSWGNDLHAPAVASGVGFTYESKEDFAIKHDNYRTLDEFITKNMRYAKADAIARQNRGEELDLGTATRLSVSELISRFFKDQGYLDGMHGLILAILQSFYYFMVYAYYWEASKYRDLESSHEIKSFPRTWFGHGLSEVLYWDQPQNFVSKIKSKLARRLIK